MMESMRDCLQLPRLGIPSILDRIVQECLRIVLEPLPKRAKPKKSWSSRRKRPC